MRNVLFAALAASLFGLTTTASNAASTTCSVTSVTLGLFDSADCDGDPVEVANNITEASLNGSDPFGITDDFGLISQIDLPGGGNNGFNITFAQDRLTGEWSLDQGLFFEGGHSYIIALKAATDSAIYLLPTSSTDATSGTWSTADLLNNGGNQPGLSNIRLFGTSGLTNIPPTTGVVPLPAAGWLLISGVAGLGVFGRFRKRAA